MNGENYRPGISQERWSPSVDEKLKWFPIATAPVNREIKVAVLDAEGYAHALATPARLTQAGWIVEGTTGAIDIVPTHWREWA